MDDGPDPFATASLRARVLDAWTASSARFREDANAEDDLVRGGYRDRVVVELAQNAADAATRAGVPGLLLLRLDGAVLVAANTGAPIDAAGVESLSTLRASTKRDGSTVGRFGVGFAAVLAVTDTPRIASATGGVSWDETLARSVVAEVPTLRRELDRRHGQLPVLRLPFPAVADVPEGYDTVVELPLRDAAAHDLAARLLAEVGDPLLLALPALAEVVVEAGGHSRTVTAPVDWQVVRRTGTHPGHLLADRPAEERDRPAWSVTWARPLRGQSFPPLLHAPTPTDEPVDLPALLIASFPLDPSRRRVAPSTSADALVGECAQAYVELVLSCDDPADRFSLVPLPVAAGGLDGQLRRSITDALRTAPWLRTVGGSPVAPRDAVTVTGVADPVLAVCADAFDGLVPDNRALARLDVRRLRLTDVVDLLAELDRPAQWWHLLYSALATAPLDVDALAALPVPLADGRLVRGARGALLPTRDLSAEVSALGLRVVHPDAAHPMLARLGAEPASPRALLERPEVRAAVDTAWDEPDPAHVTEAMLELVAAAGVLPGEQPWLAAVPLRDVHGVLAAADDLVVPGSVIEGLAPAEELAAVHPDLLERWGSDVLAAAGVLDGLTVAELNDVVLDPDALDDEAARSGLVGLTDWAADVTAHAPGPASAAVVRGVRELDVVGEDAWPRLLAVIAADPLLRSALIDPVPTDEGRQGGPLLSYTAWWVRTRGALAGRRPTEWALASARELAGLYDGLPALTDVPEDVLAAVGVRTSLRALIDEPGGPDALLDRLADPARSVPQGTLTAAYSALAGVAADAVTPPAAIRVSPNQVVAAENAVVIDAPHHLQLVWEPPALVVPLALAPAVAEVLDVAVSSDRVRGTVTGGTERPVPSAALMLVPAAPPSWWEHEELAVDGVAVSWWVDDIGRVHATTVEGLAWGLGWAAEQWPARWALAAVLSDPARVSELGVELRLDGLA